MPQQKAPLSLWRCSLRRVESLVRQCCGCVEEAHGSYESAACRVAVAHLRRLLSSSVPTALLDDLCELRRGRGAGADARIDVAAYLHAGMRRFAVKEVGLEDSFWLCQVRRLHHVRVLHLEAACSDDILAAVASTCCLLQEISFRLHRGADHVDTKGVPAGFPVRKLYFVSGEGLAQLAQCKLLTKIVMIKKHSEFPASAVDVAVVSYLLRCLPRLQHFTYDHLGSAVHRLQGTTGVLRLDSVTDHQPSPGHVTAVDVLCPHLQCLHLKVPATDCDVPAVLNGLSSSGLRITALKLEHFPCTDQLFFLFRQKGVYLHRLFLMTSDDLMASTVHVIADTCPNLRALLVYILQPSDWPYRQEADADGVVMVSPSGSACPFLCHLESLFLFGGHWRAEAVLPMCLARSRRVRDVTVRGAACGCGVDSALHEVLRCNPLSELRTLRVYRASFLSSATIVCLYHHCPRLRKIIFPAHPAVDTAHITAIREDAACKNLDFKLVQQV